MGIEGKASKCHSEVDIPGIICDKYGNEVQEVTLRKCRYNPNANFNLLSLTKLLMDGWKMTGDNNAIVMRKGDCEIRFDIVIKTETGAIYAAYIKRRNAPELQGGMVVKEGSRMSVEKAHDLLVHSHEDATRATAKHLGWELSKGAKPCQSCAESKAKQKIVPKKTEGTKAEKPNGRIFSDIATVKAPKSLKLVVARPQWHLMVDEATGMKFSAFYEKKNDIVEPTCVKLNKLADIAGKIEHLRQDNAGKNLALAKNMGSNDWKMKTKIEYTAKGTPQQNHLAELGFTTIAARTRATTNRANIPTEMRYKLFGEIANTVAKVDMLTVITLNGEKKTRYEHYQGNLPGFANHLRTVGGAGTVRIGKNGKVKDRGVTKIFVGYATQHDGDCWRMYDPETGRVSQSRDVIWLNRMYYEKSNAGTTREDPIVILEVVKPREVEEFSDDDDRVEVIPALK